MMMDDEKDVKPVEETKAKKGGSSFDTPLRGTQDEAATQGEEAKGKKEPALVFEDGTAVAAPGLGIHQIRDGKRHWVPDTWTQAKLGIRMDEVVMLFPEQLMSIPEGAPIPSKAPDEPLF